MEKQELVQLIDRKKQGMTCFAGRIGYTSTDP